MKKTCWNCRAGQYDILSGKLVCFNKESEKGMSFVSHDGSCSKWEHDPSDPLLPGEMEK